MSNPNDPHTHSSNTNTTIRESRTEKKSGTGMALIVGGLVVAVAIIAWFFFAAGNGDVATTGATTGEGDVNVSVDSAAGAAGDAATDAGNAVEGAAEDTGNAIEGAADATGNAVDGAAANAEAGATTTTGN